MDKLFTTVILTLLMSLMTLTSFGCWAPASPNELIKSADVVVDATVKYPEGSTEDHMKIYHWYKYYGKGTDFTYPVTLVIHKIIKNNKILDKNQKEIELVIDNGKNIGVSTHINFVFFDGERAIFLLKGKDKDELQPYNYPIYKLQKKWNRYVEKDNHFADPIYLEDIDINEELNKKYLKEKEEVMQYHRRQEHE